MSKLYDLLLTITYIFEFAIIFTFISVYIDRRDRKK